MTKVKKLPKEIFVHWEYSYEEQFLNATETAAGIEDGEKVGVYELVAVKTKKITEELV